MGLLAALVLAVPTYRTLVVRLLRPWVWGVLVLAFALLVRYGSFSEEHSLARHVESFLIPWLIVGTALHPSQWVSRLLEFVCYDGLGDYRTACTFGSRFGCSAVGRSFGHSRSGRFQELPLSLFAPSYAHAELLLVEKPLFDYGARMASISAQRAKNAAIMPEPELAK